MKELSIFSKNTQHLNFLRFLPVFPKINANSLPFGNSYKKIRIFGKPIYFFEKTQSSNVLKIFTIPVEFYDKIATFNVFEKIQGFSMTKIIYFFIKILISGLSQHSYKFQRDLRQICNTLFKKFFQISSVNILADVVRTQLANIG